MAAAIGRRGARPQLTLGTMSPTASRWAALALTTITLPHCKGQGKQRGGRLVVEFAGCQAVRRGPTCVLDLQTQRLTLWVRGESRQRLRAHAGSAELAPEQIERIGDGVRYRLVVPSAASEIALSRGGRTWQLAIFRERPAALLAETRALRQRGRSKQAEQRLRAALNGLSRVDRVRARALLARIALSRGETAHALAELAQTMKQFAAAGYFSDAVADALAQAYVRTVYTGEFDRAKRVLRAATAWAAADPERAASIAYYRGLIARAHVDLRRALSHFRSAAEQARRLGLARQRLHARQQLATTLATLGRTAEALSLQEALLRQSVVDRPCNRADIPATLAWIAMLNRWRQGQLSTNGDAGGPDPALLLRQARAALAGCDDPFRHRNALTNEALWALHAGDPTRARAALRRLEEIAAGHTTELSIWEAEVRGRLALLTAKPKMARAAFLRQHQLAEAAGYLQGVFRAEDGLGRCHEATADYDKALSHYRAAQAALSRWLDGVPLGEGRGSFLTQRDAHARHLVGLLHRLGRDAEASRAARRAIARLARVALQLQRLSHLSAPQRERWRQAIGEFRRQRAALDRAARSDWRLSTEELTVARERRQRALRRAEAALDRALVVLRGANPGQRVALRPPAEGELILSYFPTPQGWVAFAQRLRGAVRAVEIGELSPSASLQTLARQLLEPFDAEIGRARRLHLLPYGRLSRVDIHALPWRGKPLAAQRVVTFGMDLESPVSPKTQRAHRQNLVVGDPTGDLPHARREAQLLAKQLGHGTKLLLGRHASPSRVLAALPQTTLFHYAGHARFDGIDGTRSSLLLAGRSHLTLGDILSLHNAPRWVVLSACEAARTASERGDAGLGLAQAFISSGSRQVVAARLSVDDRLARRLVHRLHREINRDPGRDLAVALYVAQRDFLALADNSAWRIFRTISR